MPPERKNSIVQAVQTALLGLITFGVSSCIVFLININKTIGVMTEKDVQHELNIYQMGVLIKEASIADKNQESRIIILETKMMMGGQ